MERRSLKSLESFSIKRYLQKWEIKGRSNQLLEKKIDSSKGLRIQVKILGYD